VTLSASGSASYEFLIDGTATFDFDSSWLPDPERLKPSVIHIGTLVTVIEPAASVLYTWAVGVGEFAPIVFDPNIRPSVMGDREKYCQAVEKWVGISSVVKVSDDDIAWLYPGQSQQSVADRWISQGVALVVITRGANGLMGCTANSCVEVDGVKVDVVDTVGAGDTVGAIIVEAITKGGVSALKGDTLKGVLQLAARAAAITCSRAGAQPPRKHELLEVMG
jgi:fructokinase